MKYLLNYIYGKCIQASKRISRNRLYKLVKKDLNNQNINVKFRKVLFVGSGGILEKIARENLEGELITIDIDPLRSPDHIMSVDDMSFDNEVFDLILLLEVLEHVENPFDVSKELYRVLKKGGSLIVSTPFIFGIHDAPVDYWRFTKFGLRKIFKLFKDVKIEERSGFCITISTLLCRLIMCKGFLHKILGCFFSIFSLLILPILILLDLFMPKIITTGYYLKAIK